MVKQFLVIIILLILITNVYSQFIPDPFEEPLRIEYLKKRNEVKTEADKIKSKKIKSVTDICTSSYPWYNYTEFDEDGYIIQKSLIRKQTEEKSSVTFTYDLQKNVIAQYGANKQIIKNEPGEYQYDDDNGLIKFTNSGFTVCEYIYDNLNNLSEINTDGLDIGYDIHYVLNYNITNNSLIVTYNLILNNPENLEEKNMIEWYQGRSPMVITYKFDNNNNIIYKLIETIKRDGHGNYSEKSKLNIYNYDKNNKLLDESYSDESSKNEKKYFFNKNGVLTKTFYESDRGIKELSFYDEYGNIERVEYEYGLSENNTYKGVNTYKYDTNNHLIQITRIGDDKYSHDEYVTSYRYEFY